MERWWLGLCASTVIHLLAALVGLLVPPLDGHRGADRSVALVQLLAADERPAEVASATPQQRPLTDARPRARTPSPRPIRAEAARLEAVSPPVQVAEHQAASNDVAAESPGVASAAAVHDERPMLHAAPTDTAFAGPPGAVSPDVGRPGDRTPMAPAGSTAPPSAVTAASQTAAAGVAQPRTAGSGDGLADPRYESTPRPGYPTAALRRGHEGEVLLNIHVLHDGTVGEIRLERSSGHELLDQAAIKAVKRWTFSPAHRNDRPVDAWVTVPVRFSISRS